MNIARFTYSTVTCLSIMLTGSSVKADDTRPPPILDENTNTLTYPAPSYVRRTAPDHPMGRLDALRHWDGTGELILEPGPEDGPGSVSGIGAAFDNTDAGGPGAEMRDRADGRCPAGVMWYQLRGGRLALSQASYSHDDQSPRASLTRDQPGISFSTEHCRYHITLQTKTLDGGAWILMPEIASPEPKPILSFGTAGQPPKNLKVAMRDAPLPQELIPTRQTWNIGNNLPPDAVKTCPSISGMTIFEPRGVFFSQVSPMHHEFLVGVRREPDVKTTALIFQNDGCREEIHVTREISRDGVWVPSSLTADPTSAGN